MRLLSEVRHEVLVAVILLAADGHVRCHAETYYLSPNGSDRQEGTSPQKAWQTVSRGDGFAVRNNIFVVSHDDEILCAGRGIFQKNCYWRTNGNLRLAGHADLAAWRKASGQERLNCGDVGFQVDPQFRAPGGGGGGIDDAARLGMLHAYDLLPSSPLAGKGLDLQGLFKIAPGPCDFRGTPLQPGMKFSLGAIQDLPRRQE